VKRGVLVAAALCLPALLGLPAALDAQQTGNPAEDLAFIDVIDVKVVNLKVYVTDKKGNPITGLSKDDFIIEEDKRPVTVTNFYEFNQGVREGDLPVTAERKPSVESHPELRAEPDSEVPPEDQLHVVVYVDHQNIRPNNRNRVFRFVRQFLRQHVDRQDRVMLVSYNRSLKVEREFTSDAQVISRALFDLETHTGGRLSVDSDRRDIINDIEDEIDVSMLVSRAKMFAQEQHNDMQFTLDALKEMVTNLAGIPGRKALLYVSDGLPMRPGEEMFEAVQERVSQGNDNSGGYYSNLRMEAFNYDLSPRFRDLADAANASDVSFYTIDAAGLLGRSIRGADMRGGPLSSNMESTWSNNVQSPLMFMADETGGQFAVNTNNFEGAFERFATDFEHYYSLGFSPSHAGNGRLYRVEVKLKDKSIGKVRHRQTYRDKSVELEMQEGTKAALQFGTQSNPLGIKLVERDRIRRSDGSYTVHVDVQIPIGELVLLPRQDFHEARVRIWVQARDAEGGLSDPQMSPLQIQVKPDEVEQARAGYWSYGLPLLLRAGDKWITVGVRDDLGARRSFVTRVLRGEG
jgi:VWFA-related protein